MKFKSSRLAEFNYDINLSFVEAKQNKEIISMFDSQLLRSIRHLKGEEISSEYLESLKAQVNKLKRLDHSKQNAQAVLNLQNEIGSYLFVPEIISIVIENRSHYRLLFKNGLKLNNKVYRRFSSSAGQARSSTVLFCEENLATKLDEIFDNGRDVNKELVPSKFNAYKGLITSSTSVVSNPRFCLVPDFESTTEVKVNFVTETGLNEDDKIEIRTIKEVFNRFDGQGIVSIEQAKKWADELGLDYIPSQWCIRQNYLKGMLTTFDIKAFCEKINNKNYMIRTSYKDENGNPKLADLREVDIIISESQFKLWDSFSSLEEYEENCKKNNLQWGVSLLSPKKDKDILKMNYQFLQTVNLNHSDIEKVCEKFVDWLSGVTSKDVYYTLLFLLGTEIDEDSVINYLNNSENHWVKALILDNSLINDKWFRKKVYDLIKKKIRGGCLGQILVDGNFQVLVSDPFAQMQHVCGLEVKGLLKKDEHYSHYWNKKGIKTVDSMRAPLTYRSEHVLLNLQQNEDVDYWYQYNTTGIIVNAHGDETMRWAGSDFDMDIIATTSDPTIIKGVYKNELPIAYTPPKSTKTKLKETKLYNADLHSFGSEIGQITNKSTSGFALLPLLDKSSKEYEVTMNRIKNCTKLQSAQIDKAKIGRKVKSIPKVWLNYNKIDNNLPLEERERLEFLNRILLDKHPYFFIYLYKGTRNKYRNYVKNQDVTCRQKFGIGLDELKAQKRKSKEQLEFLKNFAKYSPVIESDCVMNNLCKYIESVDFGIRNVMKNESDNTAYARLFSNSNFILDTEVYEGIKKAYKEFKHNSKVLASIGNDTLRLGEDDSIRNDMNLLYSNLSESLLTVCSNESKLVDHLIYLFYVENADSNKDLLWNLHGDYIVNSLKAKVKKIKIPVPTDNGEHSYLNTNYTIREVDINE